MCRKDDAFSCASSRQPGTHPGSHPAIQPAADDATCSALQKEMRAGHAIRSVFRPHLFRDEHSTFAILFAPHSLTSHSRAASTLVSQVMSFRRRFFLLSDGSLRTIETSSTTASLRFLLGTRASERGATMSAIFIGRARAHMIQIVINDVRVDACERPHQKDARRRSRQNRHHRAS